jgi:hypothetical protein
LLEGGAVKNFICVFVVLIAMAVFAGCATTGGGAGGSVGESKSKLSEADLQRMGITHGGYGNSN